MQKDAIKELYRLALRARSLGDEDILRDFERLQTSDYFHYMSTRWFSESQPDRPNPYASPYDAYISYMNIVADLGERLTKCEETKKQKTRASRSRNASPAQSNMQERTTQTGKTADPIAPKTTKKTARTRAASKVHASKRTVKKASS